MKKLTGALLAISLLASGPAAIAADASRVSQPAQAESQFAGAPILPLIVLLAILAGAIWLVVDDDPESA